MPSKTRSNKNSKFGKAIDRRMEKRSSLNEKESDSKGLSKAQRKANQSNSDQSNSDPGKSIMEAIRSKHG